MVLQRSRLPAAEVYALLSNARRRMAVERLRVGGGAVEVSELARAIAAEEAGTRPPPTPVKESVYASLDQTHLPKLDELDVVEYDRTEKVVRASDRTREVRRYLNVAGPAGVPWDDYYRGLGTVGLCAVVAATAGLPVASLLPPLAWASATLAALAVSTVYQLWQLRGGVGSRSG